MDIAEWLKGHQGHRVTHAAMEATGNFWILVGSVEGGEGLKFETWKDNVVAFDPNDDPSHDLSRTNGERFLAA